MPNRLIREGILDSERYWSCTIEARELYRHLQLLADDFGCVSLSPAFIGRRCFDSRPTSEKLAGLILQLCDADLIRRYDAEGGVYAFIPRFKQRLQRFTLKHPAPPNAVLHNDEHAIDLFKRINNKHGNSTVGQPIANRSPTHEVEVEEKRREVEGKGKSEGETKPVDNSVHKSNPKPDDKIQGKTHWQWAQELGISLNGKGAAEVKLEIEEILAKANP